MVLGMDNQAPKTISVPEAGKQYFGLAKNASYEAAARGQIPAIRGLEAACACRYANSKGSSKANKPTAPAQ